MGGRVRLNERSYPVHRLGLSALDSIDRCMSRTYNRHCEAGMAPRRGRNKGMSAVRQATKTEFEQSLLVSIWTGIGLVFLIPLIVSTDPLPDTLFPFIVGKALFGRVVIEIIFGLWLVLAFKYPEYRVPRSWLLLVFGVYLGINVLAGMFGVSFQLSLWSTYERMQGTVDLAHWYAFTLVLVSVARSWVNWRTLLTVNLAIGFLVAVLGIAEHYKLVEEFPIYEGVWIQNIRSARLEVTLGNATYVGAYMLVNFLIGLGLLARSLRWPNVEVSKAPDRRRRGGRARQTGPRWSDLTLMPNVLTLYIAYVPKLLGWHPEKQKIDSELLTFRLFWIAVVALDFWVLILSGTRGAFIGLGAGLLAFSGGYVLWGRVRAVKMAAVGLVAVLISLSLVMVVARNSSFVQTIADSNVLVRRMADLNFDDSNVKNRFTTLGIGLEAFAARPILGWGPENFLIGWGRYFDEDPETPETFDQAHNKLVEELTTKGILGFGSYIAIWALMAAVVVQRVRTQGEREQLFTLFIGAAMAGYFVQNLFLFDTPATVLMFFLLLAFAVNLETEKTGPATSRAASLKTSGLAVRAWNALGVRRLGSAGILKSEAAPWIALTAVLVLVGLAIWSINYRPYSAAVAYVEAEIAPTWEERFDGFQRSIDYFPPLANQARMFMFSRIVHGLDGMEEGDFRAAMAIMDREVKAASENEPRGWRIYLLVASVYQRASLRAPQYLEVAHTYVERAEKLAPDTVEVFLIKTQQELLEKELLDRE